MDERAEGGWVGASERAGWSGEVDEGWIQEGVHGGFGLGNAHGAGAVAERSGGADAGRSVAKPLGPQGGRENDRAGQKRER